jgi:hypothetical protein
MTAACAMIMMMSIPDGDKTSSQLIVWITTMFMAAYHIGAISALFCLRWSLTWGGHRIGQSFF